MFSLLLLFVVGMSFWTAMTLFRKSPNDEAIKATLADLGSNFLNLVDGFLKLYDSFKSLFLLLKDSKNKNKNIDTVKGSELIAPSLISLNDNNKAA